LISKSLQIGFFLVSALPGLLAQVPASGRVYDQNPHAWVSWNGDHAVKGRWGVHFDAQWRRENMGLSWQQYQVRPGVNYQWSRHVLLTLGYVYTRTYPYGEFPARFAIPEHRVYQQALIRQNAGKVRLQHRLRMEQRFIRYATAPQPPVTYQNRFRYLLRAEFPLKKTASSEWYVPVGNEVVIGIAPNYGARPWDQNRAFVGIGRSTRRFAVDVAYLNQFLGQRNGRVFEVNHTLMIGITAKVAPWRAQK